MAQPEMTTDPAVTTNRLRPRRSCLAVPGSSPRFLDKARDLPADQVFLDLEDACAPLVKELFLPLLSRQPTRHCGRAPEAPAGHTLPATAHARGPGLEDRLLSRAECPVSMS